MTLVTNSLELTRPLSVPMPSLGQMVHSMVSGGLVQLNRQRLKALQVAPRWMLDIPKISNFAGRSLYIALYKHVILKAELQISANSIANVCTRSEFEWVWHMCGRDFVRGVAATIPCSSCNSYPNTILSETLRKMLAVQPVNLHIFKAL